MKRTKKRIPLSARIGESFGRLTILAVIPPKAGEKRFSRFRVRCSCGKRKTVAASNVLTGNISSCGCGWVDAMVTHGHTRQPKRTPEYQAWMHMKSRCNPNVERRDSLVKDGIEVCAKWANSFIKFFADMGRKPSAAHWLRRIDPDKDYKPGNVHWTLRRRKAKTRRAR